MMYSVQVRKNIENRTSDNWRSQNRSTKRNNLTLSKIQQEIGEINKPINIEKNIIKIESLHKSVNERAKYYYEKKRLSQVTRSPTPSDNETRQKEDCSHEKKNQCLSKVRKSRKIEQLLRMLKLNLLQWHQRISKFNIDQNETEITIKDFINDTQNCLNQFQYSTQQIHEPFSIQKKILFQKQFQPDKLHINYSENKNRLQQTKPGFQKKVINTTQDLKNGNVNDKLDQYFKELFQQQAKSLFYQHPALKGTSFKYYVGKGNNSNLIKKIMGRRWWWKQVESIDNEQVNFIWTQIKNSKTYEFPFAEQLEEIQKIKKILKFPTLFNNQNENVQFSKGILQKQFKNAEHNSYICCSSASNNYLHNHINSNKALGNKKSLLYFMKQRFQKQVFQFLPLSFHIERNFQADSQYHEFLEFIEENDQFTWLVKPGEDTNRGKGIKVCQSLEEIQEYMFRKKKYKSFIIQKYIQNLLLYKKRKFDIRCFGLINFHNYNLRSFWYEEGYVRTSSFEFNEDNIENVFIHLTNDAIQQKGTSYGKFEQGNKVSFKDFNTYIKKEYPNKTFFDDIYPKMKVLIFLAMEAIRSVKNELLSNGQKQNFELYGFDFIIDQNFQVWLIECNTNPCLEFSCSLLQTLLTDLIDNTLRIALDPQFPPPQVWPISRCHLLPIKENKFEEFQC